MATLVQLCHSLRLFPIPLSFQIRDLGFLLCLMKEGLMNEMQRSKEGLMKKMQRKKMEVSKLGKLKCKDEHDSVQDVKADDLRQMLLAMTVEVRVIIVKLASRLHNIRTLSHMPPHKQSSIARETLQVFAPLAKLLGMYQIKYL